MGVGDICRQEINTQKIKNRAQPVRERAQAGETEKPPTGRSPEAQMDGREGARPHRLLGACKRIREQGARHAPIHTADNRTSPYRL